MPIVDSDIVVHGAANMPEDDVSLTGGGIDVTTKVVFTDIAATASVTVVSSNAGDTTQTVTITGRLASGLIDSEVLNLNGTTRVAGAKLFERILKIVVSAAHAGTITVTRNNNPTYTEIATLETAILTVRRLFYNAAADVAGGASRSFYEKVFIRNIHATLALNSAVIKEFADPTTFVTFDLEDAKGDNNSVANRLTAPTGMLGAFTNNDKNVPGGSLGPGENIGVWLKLTLAAGTAPSKSTWTVRTSGTTT